MWTELAKAECVCTLGEKITIIATKVAHPRWAIAYLEGDDESTLKLRSALYHDGEKAHTVEEVGDLLVVADTGRVISDQRQFVGEIFA